MFILPSNLPLKFNFLFDIFDKRTVYEKKGVQIISFDLNIA